MAERRETDADLAELVRQTAEAAAAFIRGDMRRYVELIRHADDYTLMAPFGGGPRRGFDDSEEALDATGSFFQGGEAELELVQTHASRDLAVLVVIERQHGRIGGLADQDLSLRVTLVFRRDDGEWRLVHQHADPMVHPIGLEQVAALLRGEEPGS
jgi:ketosteroid isomerase-like protein